MNSILQIKFPGAGSARSLLPWKVFVLVLMTGLVSASTSLAQDLTVSGKVSSADDGMGLPGVTILLKGSSAGTSSDAEGNYKLTVPNGNGTLIFSFIGYSTLETEIAGRSVIDVSLQTDITELSEVVVIGYGEVKKSNVTGSIVSVKPEDLLRVPSTNVTSPIES
jgi:hypothetical protein